MNTHLLNYHRIHCPTSHLQLCVKQFVYCVDSYKQTAYNKIIHLKVHDDRRFGCVWCLCVNRIGRHDVCYNSQDDDINVVSFAAYLPAYDFVLFPCVYMSTTGGESVYPPAVCCPTPFIPSCLRSSWLRYAAAIISFARYRCTAPLSSRPIRT